MTETPTTPAAPATIGSQPRNADELNGLLGLHLRAFLDIKNPLNQDQAFLAATDLTLAPYFLTGDQQTAVKSAINSLDTGLDALDMTFVVRLIGMGGSTSGRTLI